MGLQENTDEDGEDDDEGIETCLQWLECKTPEIRQVVNKGSCDPYHSYDQNQHESHNYPNHHLQIPTITIITFT